MEANSTHVDICLDLFSENKSVNALFADVSSVLVGVGFKGIVYHHLPYMGSLDYSVNRIVLSTGLSHREVVSGWDETYYRKYDKKLDPIEAYYLKRGGAGWSGDLYQNDKFKSKDEIEFLDFTRKGPGLAVIVPVFGPRRSRGCFILMTGDIEEGPSLRSICHLEYICAAVHREICKIQVRERAELKITPRELEVLELIPLGLSNTEIGSSMGISPNTVNGHLKQIFTKLSAEDRLSASLRAFSLDLIN